MKKLFLIGFLFIGSLALSAQENADTLLHEVIIGRNFKTNTDIKAVERVFADNIHLWHIDDSTKVLTLQLRGSKDSNGTDLNANGYIVSYDLSQHKIEWQQNIYYQYSNLDLYNDILIKTTNSQSSRLNNENGEAQWQAKNTIYYANPALKIGVGYRCKSSDDFSNWLEGIDLNTGKVLWKREVTRAYGMNDISALNDSVILILADGVHAVNLKTGVGWDYNAKTGKKDYSSTIAANVFSIGLGLLLGSQPEIYSGHDLFTDMVSNVLTDSTGVYLANKSSVVKLNHNGVVVWEGKLPSGLAGKSALFLKNSQLGMVNWGFAYKNGELVHYGKPFVVAFDRNSGKQNFFQAIDYRREKINAFDIQHDTIFLMSKNKIFKYSLKSGVELWEQVYKDSIGQLNEFAAKDMYFETDSTFTNLYASDSSKVYAYTDKSNLLVLDCMLKPIKIIPQRDIFYCYLETNGYKFLENGSMTVVIDRAGKEVAELNINGNVQLRGNRLFEVEANSLIEINIDQLIYSNVLK
jgi:hypothetical protein